MYFTAAKAFLIRATDYLLKWCPLEDELLTHATRLDFENRLEKNFLSVQYFVLQYPEIFPDMNMDRLNEQFLNYQLLPTKNIPTIVKESAGLSANDPHRVDILWGYLRGMEEKTGSRSYKFDLLFKVAEVVMIIPHSNAEERLFSLISKNKTPGRQSLKLNGTLSSSRKYFTMGTNKKSY